MKILFIVNILEINQNDNCQPTHHNHNDHSNPDDHCDPDDSDNHDVSLWS